MVSFVPIFIWFLQFCVNLFYDFSIKFIILEASSPEFIVQLDSLIMHFIILFIDFKLLLGQIVFEPLLSSKKERKKFYEVQMKYTNEKSIKVQSFFWKNYCKYQKNVNNFWLDKSFSWKNHWIISKNFFWTKLRLINFFIPWKFIFFSGEKIKKP